MISDGPYGMTKSNNFHLARLMAATLVVFGHSFALLLSPNRVVWFDDEVSAFAVRIFFVISGYLICRSWSSDPNLLHYLAKRCLRIFPALFVVVMLTACVLGPLMTTVPLHQYVSGLAFKHYFWNILLAPNFELPGVFESVPFKGAVNGSLWTLPAEFFMYLLVPIYGSRNHRLCRFFLFPAAFLAALLIGCYFTFLKPLDMQPVFYWTSLAQVARWAPYFLGGAAFAVWKIERFLRLDVAMIIIWLVTCLAPVSLLLQDIAVMILTPYVVLAFCLSSDGAIPAFDWEADISYGTYLYAFPIQQTLITVLGNKVAPLHLFCICIPIVYAVALLSWLIIEKPALSLKPRRPRLINPVAVDPRVV
jgi:peptidoglycan/LPS O-acetylase OafA/YrhL